MATLNTLRTRFGALLSAVIAFALLAFIFSLKSEMGFSGNDPVVAQINGQDVTMSDYSSEYNAVQRQSGVTEIDEQQAEVLYNTTWQSLITKFALTPGFQDMGIEIGEAERMAIISGVVPTQAMYGAFADPSTGVYNVAMVNNFLATSKGDPEAESIWSMVNEMARVERRGNKYMALVMAGVNVNSLEVANAVEGANKSYAGRWARKSYSAIADSLVNVTSAEIKSFYDDNKSLLKRQPSRTLSYVTFNVTPSESDLANIEDEVNTLSEEFTVAEDLSVFVRENRNASITDNYISVAQLSADEAENLSSGGIHGPINDGSSWRTSRVFESVTAPDTLSLRHIVLSYTDGALADSLTVALRNGADFAATAMTYSQYAESAQNGGDIGAVPFSALSNDFATELASAKVGDILNVATGDMIQLIQVYGTSAHSKHYKIAYISTPIYPSEETRRTAHNSAGLFAVAASGGYDKFSAAATESEVVPHSVDLVSSSLNIAAVSGSQEVARWAHRAKVGDLSEIFKVNDGYLVAMLTNINDNEIMTLSDVETMIERRLLNEKKFDMLKGELSGSTFDEISSNMDSESGEFSDLTLASYYINGIGVEPQLIGSITNSKEAGNVSSAIEGNSGLFIYEVSSIVDAEEPQSLEAEKVLAESMQQRVIQQLLFGSLESLSNVKDMRGANL